MGFCIITFVVRDMKHEKCLMQSYGQTTLLYHVSWRQYIHQEYPQIIKQKQQTPNNSGHERSASENTEQIKENHSKNLIDYYVITISPMTTRQRQLLESIYLF